MRQAAGQKAKAQASKPQAEGETMKRLTLATAIAALLILAIPGPASASFGIKGLDVAPLNEDGTAQTQAGAHPFAVKLDLAVNTKPEPQMPEIGVVPDEAMKDLTVTLPPGFVGSPIAVPRCSMLDFISPGENSGTACPTSTQIGKIQLTIGDPGTQLNEKFFNLEPPPGVPAKLGFNALGVRITSEVSLSESPPYNLISKVSNAPNIVAFYSAKARLWSDPADPAHDKERGGPVDATEVPFLTMPRSCQGPLPTVFRADSWEHPGGFVEETIFTHDDAEPPVPIGFTGCGKVDFGPRIESEPTTRSAESPSGLDFSIDINDEGLSNPTGIAASDLKDAKVTLPEGMTINPSVAEGLEVCTPAQVARENSRSLPGEGCPQGSKLGSVHVVTPVIEEAIDGSVYLAQQDDPSTSTPGAENPFDSLIALYIVLQNENLGVSVKIPVKIEPDPKTGQLIATAEGAPQLPFSEFAFHFREGARSPLITPPACGDYETKAEMTPWSGNPPVIATSSFEITSGVGGGPCPPGGVPPFHPHFEAGSINNNAGSFSPFNMRVIRGDGEQDMTKFSATLPPGELGSLAGVGKCPDAAIAAARAKSGRQELASPSCPSNSLIGHTLAGAGVGGALTYVKGYAYLGGAFHGDPLSVIAVTPALAGPFDAGTVVVQEALTLNPKTAEVEVDGANSEPIPHIIKGIVLKLRDLRVYVDRPNFTLNPTSCDESSARSVLFGGYLDVFSSADDKPVDLSTRYQAANCLNLGFKPKLDLKLKGGTKRGGHPGLIATYTPKAGDANVKGLVVRLPRSAFLDQAHIKTICTRVQFAAKQCPERSQYGFIKAWTPLLDTPLEGPVYLRSSNHKLPDLVFDLHGLVDVEVGVRIDSAHGGIRATLEDAPDAPLSKVDLRMQGAKKVLIINSRNLCGSTNRANVEFSGQNGKQLKANPVMKPDCGGGRK